LIVARRAAPLQLCVALAAGLATTCPALAQENTVPTPLPRPVEESGEALPFAPDAANAAAPQISPAASGDEAAPLTPGGTAPAPGGTLTPPTAAVTKPPAGGLNPERFGGRPVDVAYGAFQRGLYVTAYNLAMVRARNGDPAAQTLVAEIVSRGLGVPLSQVEAAKWYALAAEQGIPEAQFQYALMLLDGTYVKRDVNGAYALLEAAAEAGNVLAQFNFAQLIVEREPGDAGMAKAASYYERAANAGLADAQYALSQIYGNGAGGRKRDEVEARRWLELAARQGFDTAEVDLGTWMVQGRGGPKQRKAGFALLRRAALGGNVAAQNRVAKLYMQGVGVEPDSIMAAAWYIVARRAGLNDPEMDDLLNGLTAEETKEAIGKANRLR
jgi:TPR repeat protein